MLKKLHLFFLFFIVNFFIVNAQCPDEDIILKTQSDIDNFKSNYPNCTELLRSLQIGSVTEIENLNGLNEITKIGVDLNIGESVVGATNSLINLKGLDSLKVIGRNLIIQRNSSLLSLEGLENLTEVKGFISIFFNSEITSLRGIKSLEAANGITIESNAKLQTIEHLIGLKNINPSNSYASINIIRNDVLVNLRGLDSIKKVKGVVNISRNNKLQDLYGLQNLNKIDGRLGISRNPNLKNLKGLEELTEVNGDFGLGRNSKMVNLEGIPKLKIIAGEFLVNSTYLENFYGLNIESVNKIKININYNLKNLIGLEKITKVPGDVLIQSNHELINLNGFNNIKSVGGELIIGFNNKLEEINLGALEDVGIVANQNFNDLSIKSNSQLKLLKLNSLKKIVGSLRIEKNEKLSEIKSLKNLESISTSITLRENNILETLEGLENLTETSLYISNNLSLKNIEALKSINSLKTLSIYNNTSLISLNGLDSLKKLKGSLYIEKNNSLKSLESLESLNSIDGRLIIEGNNNLESLSGIQNINSKSINRLEIRNNPKLSTCQTLNVCNYITNGGTYTIENNANGCNNADEIKNLCGDLFNTITGQVLYDINNTGCDSTSIPVQNRLVISSNELNSFYAKTDSIGKFLVYTEEGRYSTRIYIDNYLFNETPKEQTSLFRDLSKKDTVNFCVTKNITKKDVSITIIPTEQSRTGGVIGYVLVYENKGTEPIESSDIKLEFNKDKYEFQRATEKESSFQNGLLTWNIENLQPFEQKIITVYFKVFKPPIANTGDIIRLFASVNGSFSDYKPEDNVFELIRTIVGPFDPNDKTVLEGNSIYADEIENYLHYVIRFQNIGTASAINVRVEDILDEKLDIETFQLLASSHNNLDFSIKNRKATFLFNEINLVHKEENEELSNGYLSFKIKPKKDVAIGDIISGEANIFFDFEQPITTNNVSTEIIDKPLSTDKNEIKDFSIYPNPTNSLIKIQSKTQIISLSISNSIGQTLRKVEKTNIDEIDISNFKSGIYYLILKDDLNRKSTIKIFKN